MARPELLEVRDAAVASAAAAPVRLNLGAGETEIPGFMPVDRKRGQEVFPLAAPDGSVDEIRASHVLEHFSHREVPAVLADWARALKPGGLLRVAVPDFEQVARGYLGGRAQPTEGYVMGGHLDGDDRHGAIFDEESLIDLLRGAGLHGYTRWESEIQDCAALPVSLNLQAWKRPARWPRVAGVMSVPRLGFTDQRECVANACRPLNIPVRQFQGAFWGQCLTRGLEATLAEGAPEFVLTLDYDTIFTAHDLEALLSAASRHPQADAVAALQVHRHEPRPLMTLRAEDGRTVSGDVPIEQFRPELVRCNSAHFGLTLLRASALRRCRKPWFWGQPDSAHGWGDGHIDDDTWFWRQWRESGLSLYVAMRVPVGHLELAVRWPDRRMSPIHQAPAAFWASGKPAGVWR